jgi:Carbohydrate binding domain
MNESGIPEGDGVQRSRLGRVLGWLVPTTVLVAAVCVASSVTAATQTTVTIDFSTAPQCGQLKSLPLDFYEARGIVFTGNFTRCAEYPIFGRSALHVLEGSGDAPGGLGIEGLHARFTTPVVALSMQALPALSGTAEYTLTAFDDAGGVAATTSKTVTQDPGDPADQGVGYFTIELGAITTPATSFVLTSRFIRSSLGPPICAAGPGTFCFEFAVSPITFVAVGAPPPVEPARIENGSFEAGIAPWVLRHDLGATVALDSTTHTDGAYSARVDSSVADPASPHRTQLRQEHHRLRAGRTYTLVFWAKASAARPIVAKLQSSVSPYKSYLTQTINLTTQWQRFAVSYFATVSDANAFAGFNLAQTAGTVWLDDIRMSDTNVLQNGSFELRLTHWTLRRDLGATVALDNRPGQHKEGSLASSARVDSTVADPAFPHRTQLRQENVTLRAGKTYALAFWVKASAVRPIVVKLQSPVSPYASYFTRTINLTTQWQQFTLVHTAAVADANAFVGFNLAQSTGQVWIDQVSLAELP